jgi:hypothetical protein
MSGKKYLIFGVIFLAIGITMLMTGSGFRTMAYGDFVLAFAFFALSLKADKKTEDDKKDSEESDENEKDE